MDKSIIQTIQPQPTILRIKRKRTDEPLDALVVESRSRRKKSRGGSGFFQFVETVEEETFWQDPSLTKDLRTRISTLASGEFTPEKSERDPRPPVTPDTPSNRRYTIVKKELQNKSPPIVQPTSQPKAPINEDFTMYDAVPESHLPSSNDTEPSDPEMDKFIPMLQEYLRMNNEPSRINTISTKHDEGEGYVWDVFYHRPTVTEWAAAAKIATISGLPPGGQYDSESDSDSAGDEDDEDSNTEDFYRNDYPDQDPDEDSDNSDDPASDEEYPDVPDDINEDERDLNAFLAWRARR